MKYVQVSPSYRTIPSAMKNWQHKRVASHVRQQSSGTLYFYNISVHMKSGLIGGVVFLDEGNFIVFYAPSVGIKIWPACRVAVTL